jgi:hypothetical protein
MKKLLTIAVAVALSVAAAGQVQAAAPEMKGEFRARYWYLDKYFQTLNPAADDKNEFVDQRLRLTVNWPVAEGVKVGTRFDVLEQFWGGNDTFSTLNFFTADPQISFDQVYAQFAFPGTPLTATVGKQDVSWGPGILAKSDNRFRAKMVAAIAPVTVGFAWDKNVETLHGATTVNGTPNQDDADGFTLSLSTDAAGFKVGLLGAYSNDETVANVDAKRYGGDIFAMGKLGIASVNAEFAYYGGKNENAGAAPDQDVSGMLGYLGVSAPVGPATLSIEGAYASGDDKGTKENEGVLKFDYQSPFWSVILFNNFDLPGWESTYSGDTSVNNAMAAKISCAAKVMPALTLYGAAVYAQRLEETAVGANNDEALGTELDLIAMYSVTENVGINVGFGYLMVGDAYGDNVDDPWGGTFHVNVNF